MKKQKVSCSTPEHRVDSPSRDSESMSDSDRDSSPVPFLCTQDGAEGETDVVWNFYTPKSEYTAKSRIKNSTPVSRRSKRTGKTKLIDRHLPKRRAVKLPQKKTALFQELIELNQNVHELITKPKTKVNSGSEDDIFSESPEYSPKSRMRSNSLCLRRNVLSSNFVKNEPDAALESDDSMNECLIKASQIVEEKIKTETAAKLPNNDRKFNNRTLTSDFKFEINHDSMDAILNSINLESSIVKDIKKCESPILNNDSFDSLVGNLNDSALEKITRLPIEMDTMRVDQNKIGSKDNSSWFVKELVVNDNSPTTKSIFGRHSSMPESPTISNVNKPSTSGMVFGRYSSMPFGKDKQTATDTGDSPIRCTPDEIKKKHQLAREKLMAKKRLPFTSTQKPTQTVPSTQTAPKTQQLITSKANTELSTIPKKQEPPVTKKFQHRVPTTAIVIQNRRINNGQPQSNSNLTDLKSIIEKKRQEALMKLQRKQFQSK